MQRLLADARAAEHLSANRAVQEAHSLAGKLQEELGQLQQELQAQSVQAQQAETRAQQAERECVDLRTAYEQGAGLVAQVQADCAAIAGQRDALVRERDQLLSQLQAAQTLQAQRDAVLHECDHLRSQLEVTQSIAGQRDALVRERDQLLSQLQAAQTLQAQRDTVLQERDHLRSQLEVTQSMHSQSSAELGRMQAAYRDQLEQASAETQRLRGLLVSHERQEEASNELLQELQSQFAETQTQLAETQAQLAETQGRLSETEAKVNADAARAFALAELTREAEERKMTIHRLTLEKHSLTKQLQDSQASLASLTCEHSKQSTEHEAAIERMQRLLEERRTTLQRTVSERDNAASRLTAYEQKLRVDAEAVKAAFEIEVIIF